jgi:bifunctional DNA-binding transcriptional regulator/antitoxin component of YhaV-PrlF toxin-antitoxin module
MTVTVKGNAPIVVPPSVRRKAGFKAGDKLQFEARGDGVITIRAKCEDDDDPEYTPEQLKALHVRLDEAMEEYKRGEAVGPFNTAEEMIASMRSELKRRRAQKKSRQ